MHRGDSGGVVEKKAAKPVTKVKTLFQNLPVDIEGNHGTLSSYVATKNYIFDIFSCICGNQSRDFLKTKWLLCLNLFWTRSTAFL